MKKSLLMTTALVAAFSVTNAYAEDEYITQDVIITGNTNITEDNADQYATTGNFEIKSGTITAAGDLSLEQAYDGTNKKQFSITGGDITLSESAGIFTEGFEGQYNTIAADLNISGGNITVEDSGEITVAGNANLNISNNANILMDYTNETPKNDHDGGILHEGKNGDINISGGVINLKGEVAKIERGGYEGEWVYDKNGNSLMSADELYEKTGHYFIGELTDEEITNAGLNPEEVSKNQYQISNGNINIKGGTITLEDEARISLTEKNTGNLNISGGTINGTEIGNYGVGDVNITGGNITATDIGAEQGNITISNGTVNMIKIDNIDSEGLYASEKLTIKGGTVNVSGDQNVIWGENIHMTGGELNIEDSVAFVTDNAVDINAGTVNIAENSSLGWATVNGDNIEFDTTVGEDSDIDLGSKATLNLKGTLDTNIESAGTINFLNNNAQISGNVEIANGGVMNVGLNNAVVAGDLVFDAGSTLNLSVTDEGNGSVTANNIIAEENSKLALTVSKTMDIGETADITLFNTNGIIDNNFTNEVSNARYKVATEDGKVYSITYENSASDVVTDAGGTIANATTAEAWDSLASSNASNPTTKAVANALNNLSQNNPKAYVDALTAIAPDVAPAIQQTATETANQVFGAVGTRLSGGSVSTGGKGASVGGRGHGMSHGHKSGRRGMSSGDNTFERSALWVQGMYNKSKLDDTEKSNGFDSETSGVAFGAESFVSNNTKVGIGYAYSQTEIDGFMRTTDVDTHTAILYGEYKPNNWYLNAIATYGWSDYSENKNVANVNVNADYDVETFGLQAMTGYDVKISNVGLTPEVGVRYVHIKQDDYKDSADQKISASDSDILTGVIGAKLNKTWELNNGAYITPEVRVAATYDLVNDDTSSIVTLANGSAYTVNGEALDEFGLEVGAGLTAEVNDNIEFSLGYEGKFREDYQDHTGLISAKYKF